MMKRDVISSSCW